MEKVVTAPPPVQPIDPDQIFEHLTITVEPSSMKKSFLIIIEYVQIINDDTRTTVKDYGEKNCGFVIIELLHPKIQEAYDGNRYIIFFLWE